MKFVLSEKINFNKMDSITKEFIEYLFYIVHMKILFNLLGDSQLRNYFNFNNKF